ncbi:sugar ABC transporter permease [Bosea sp. (in: a-proteobacteria)]|jgi:multiple sugar transport system permease protein|uniref:carbohydrate ABC transporter permease n=1 Tax=Bosea sp. (in: a-proteobacteria) TaxID=1871050 RepID=UPI00086F2841|nr:sugar ABC transporter permease [Bosea sp. (in: a-proteobacteria)]MBN9438035.1 sugar ABC transporter permease [Bosea sp. (in: a-proteobacteria)]MBN9470400.1 sugar ABC transporter permease [Bosea sp. (in: a-proteobacteria)]ODT55091.1 MAG: ABC transporter permease [Methylobacterium sp. SCN 67-24]
MPSRYDWVIWTVFWSGLALTALFVGGPVLDALWLSLHQASSFIAEPRFVGLANYGRVVVDPEFWRAMGNGLFYALTSIGLQVVLGIAFALVLNQTFPAQRLVRGLATLPYLLPTVVVALTFQWLSDGSVGLVTVLMRDLGFGTIPWFEQPWTARMSVVLASVWLWTPFVTICVLAGLQTIPPALYEAARVDGAGPVALFWHVTLPQLKPVLTVVVLLRGIWMFNKFDIIWLLTKGGPLGATEHLPIMAYKRAFSLFDVGGGAAVATLSFLMLSIVVTIYLRLFPLEEKR